MYMSVKQNIHHHWFRTPNMTPGKSVSLQCNLIIFLVLIVVLDTLYATAMCVILVVVIKLFWALFSEVI